MLAVLLLGAQYRRKPAPKLWSYLPALAIVVVYLYLNVHWYGQVLPSSAAAKIGQGRSGFWGRWPTAFLRTGALMQYGLVGHTRLVVAGLMAAGLAGLRCSWLEGVVWVRPVTIFLAGLLAFYVLFNLPGYHWYYAPFLFYGIVFAAMIMPHTRRWRAGLAAGCILLAGYSLRDFRGLGPNPQYIWADAWLLKHAATGSRVATPETGLIGWQLQDYYIIDTVGLTTPRNAVFTAHREFGRWIEEDRADYALVHSPNFPWDKAVARDSRYRMVASFDGEQIWARQGVAP